MNQQDLQIFEGLCRDLYGPNPTRRNLADKKLGLFNRKEAVPQLKSVLIKSKAEPALFFSCECLKKLLIDNWNVFNTKQKLSIRNFVLDFLGRNSKGLNKNVLTKLIEVVSIVCKFGWLEVQSNRDLPLQIQKCFIQRSKPDLSCVGICVLSGLCNQINKYDSQFSLRQHRKICCSFRDLALRNIFESAIYCIREVKENKSSFNMYERLANHSLDLILACLTFDFVGIYPEEGVDEVMNISVPDSWRPLFEDSNTIEMLWEIFLEIPSEKAKGKLLKILVYLSIIRNGIFTDDKERLDYLNKFLIGCCKVLLKKKTLVMQQNYHDFCRLLSKLKSNFTLSDFIKCKCYNKWIEMISKFSVHVFKNWKFSPNSIGYILELWKSLLENVHNRDFFRSRNRSKRRQNNGEMLSKKQLEALAPNIACDYIMSRMEIARGFAQEEMSFENPLETPDLIQQLSVVPYLIHSDYKKVQKTLIGLYNNIFKNFKMALSNNRNEVKFKEYEGQLSWLIYLFGSVIGHKTHTPQEKVFAQEIDAHLTMRVFNVFEVINQRLQVSVKSFSSLSLQRLELSVLSFMKVFRKKYLMDSKSNVRFFEVIKNIINVDSQEKILSIFIDKVSKNLRFWGKSKKIVTQTLSIFEHLATSYKTGKLVAKLETTAQILKNHSPDKFSFLREQCNIHQRTKFYQVLARVLFLKTNCTESNFLAFMAPITTLCEKLLTINSPQVFGGSNVALALHGLFRDLRGICSACKMKHHYEYFFNWFYPKYFSILYKSVQIFADNHVLVYAPLKFLKELVTNKGRRIDFAYSSPNGILLFKETSKIIVLFGNRMKNKRILNDPYKEKFKGIRIMINTLNFCLIGNYCNFGVFELYKDSCLIDALRMVINSALNIPKKELQQYTKLRDSYYTIVENLFKRFIELVIQFDSNVFLKLLESLGDGLMKNEANLSTKTCAALDNLCVYLFKSRNKKNKYVSMLTKHLANTKNFFHKILNSLFKELLHGECGNQWSVSRVMLSLICIDPQYFSQLQNNIVNSLTGNDRKEKMKKQWKELMKGVEFNLENNNRDTFTNNIIRFVDDTKKFL